VAQGEAFDPSPDNIEARTARYTLPNGLSVALLQKETRGDLAIVRVRLHAGDEESLMGRGTAGELAGSMLMRGTSRHTRQELLDELDRLETSGGVSGGPVLASGQFQTNRANVADILRIAAEVVREPAFPEEEFNLMKEQLLVSLDQSRSEPDALAGIALARHMERYPPGHPSYTGTIEESIEAIEATTLDDVRAFYEDFWGPQRGNIVIVGDFDEGEIREVIREAFGDWESPHPFTRIAAPFYDAPPTEIEIETPDKANAVFMAQLNLALRDTDPDYPALLMAGHILGGGVLNSRLARRIRVEDGLSYGVFAGISGHPVDPVGQFTAYAISAPENVDAVQEAFLDELDRALRDGFTDDELRVAKQGWLESRQLGRAQDSSLAAVLSQGLYFERTLDFDASMEERVEAVTLDEVNQALREWIDPSKLTIVRVGDFAGR